MARIDYYAIEQELQRILLEEVSGTSVTIETDVPMDSQPWVAIYLEKRETPSAQPVVAGTQTRIRLRFSIWCWCWSIESTEVAAKLRDDLLGKVEVGLMKNRKIGGKVLHSFLEGGEMLTTNYQSDTGTAYISGGEVVLIAEATATTT